MKYTKAQRKAMAQVFTRALERLPLDGRPSRSLYICDNIGLVDAPYHVRKMCKDLIAERLQYYFCLESWLKEEVGVSISEIAQDRYNGRRKLQATRKAWLRSLIEEFSK